MKRLGRIVLAAMVSTVLCNVAIVRADELDNNATDLVNQANNSANGVPKYIPPVGTIINGILHLTNPANTATDGSDPQAGQEDAPPPSAPDSNPADTSSNDSQ
jgi:hypothetical protein